MTLPLEGLRIVDLTAVVSGPMATQMLADQGADVVKIEPLPAGELNRLLGTRRGPVTSLYETINKGKRSVGLNLKDERGREILAKLIEGADALVENFRPGALGRLGFSEERLRELHPELIYVSITGFGPDGPYSGLRVYDAIVQAVSGMAAIQGNPETEVPELVRNLACDKITSLTAAQAITAALLHQVRSGKGSRVELSMLDASIAFLFPDGFNNEMFLPDEELGDAESTPRLDTYRPYATKDGAVTLMIVSDKDWAATCRAAGTEELIEHPLFADTRLRRQNPGELRAAMEEALAPLATEHVVRRMAEEGAPCARVNSREQVLSDPQVLNNRIVQEHRHPHAGRMIAARGAAIFDGERQVPDVPSPLFGQHTDEVLEEIGVSGAERDVLRADGVIP